MAREPGPAEWKIRDGIRAVGADDHAALVRDNDMPFTPMHFGYGALFHAASPRRVSFLAFCAVNVIIDVEPLFYMASGQYPIHRFLHTAVGATLAVATVAALHCLVSRTWLRSRLPDILQWKSLTTPAIVLGAVLGACSHVVLDAVMHDDVRPLHPFSERNPLLWCVSIDRLNWSCVAAGLAAVTILAIRRLRKGAGRSS